MRGMRTTSRVSVRGIRAHECALLTNHTDDGLTACPICNARMKEEAVFAHLDVHNVTDTAPVPDAKTTRYSSLFDITHAITNAPKTIPILCQCIIYWRSIGEAGRTTTTAELFLAER